MFACLRAQGVIPHAESDSYDSTFADELLAALAASENAATTPESSLVPSPYVGVAEGDYPRTLPVTDAAIADCGSDGAGCGFQEETIARVGTWLDMLADVASMGAGRIRRIKQCDVYWACAFPYQEQGDGTLHQYGQTIPPPSEIVTALEADDGSGTLTFKPLSATTSMLIAALCYGVKVDLSLWNGGGGMDQNYSPADNERAEFVPVSGLIDSAQTWAGLLDAAPAWQRGLLVSAAGTLDDATAVGWDAFYTPTADFPDGATGEEVYHQYVVNVWPTAQDDHNVTSTAFAMECRRRKCLAMAAFAYKIGDWLHRIDLALQACCGGSIYDVVDTIDIGSELNQFFELDDVEVDPATDVFSPVSPVARGAAEAGRYMALLAGPVRAWLPSMRFRMDLESWLASASRTSPTQWVDSFEVEVRWMRRVVANGIVAEAGWWDAIAQARSGIGTAGAEVVAWLASESAAGFAWPQSPDGSNAVPSGGDLLHEVGLNCYHGYNMDQSGAAYDGAYASAARLAGDVERLELTMSTIPNFALSVVVGEIGFPAIYPGAPGLGVEDWSPYYEYTSETLQAAMHVRTVWTLLAAGVDSTFLYTFNFGTIGTGEAYGSAVSGYCAWLAAAATGLHNDVAYGATDECGTYSFTQGAECWPRPAWYANRRILWLLAQAGSDPRAAVSAVVNHIPMDGGLTILRLDFGLNTVSVDPLGAPLVSLDGSATFSPVRYAYLIWVDQTADSHDPGGRVRLVFRFPTSDDSTWTLLSLVPTVDPSGAAVGPHGYAEPAEADVVWEWTGSSSETSWNGALVSASVGTRPLVPVLPPRATERVLSLLVRRCDTSLSALALAPLCLLTSAEFDSTFP